MFFTERKTEVRHITTIGTLYQTKYTVSTYIKLCTSEVISWFFMKEGHLMHQSGSQSGLQAAFSSGAAEGSWR
jgi:hypothetical protein